MEIIPYPTEAILRFVEREDPDRQRLEQHIHACYAHVYEADINHFLPTLISVERSDGSVLCAMGVRPAAREPLFLEQYLDHPIEQVLGECIGSVVDRSALVELGNLAAGSPGAARILIVALSAYLRGAGFEWVVFTAVPAVRNTFVRMNLHLIELAMADGARLGPDLARWGNYYAQRPVVVACNVPRGYAQLHHAMQTEQSIAVPRGLWNRALFHGTQRAGTCR